jgi:hypothetical protein
MRYLVALAALAATTAFAVPAAAQNVPVPANAEARGLIIQPLTFTRLSDLNFGTIISTSTAGSVTVSPLGNTRTATGGAVLAPSGPPTRALFEGYGAEGQTVVLSASFPTTLTNQSDSTRFVTFRNGTFDGALSRQIPVGGSFRVGVGGTIDIVANQAPGLYLAPFTVTADYQ